MASASPSLKEISVLMYVNDRSERHEYVSNVMWAPGLAVRACVCRVGTALSGPVAAGRMLRPCARAWRVWLALQSRGSGQLAS